MAVPVEELQSFLKGFAPSTQHPNNPLAQGAMPSANRAAPQFNPNLPGSYTNPSNPNLNPSLPGALNNPSNPQFNPSMPGAINNPSNPQRNPSLPSSLTNPSNPQMNPAFPGSFTNPSNPINNPDFPTPSEYPPPAGIGPDASVPPSRWSAFNPIRNKWILDPEYQPTVQLLYHDAMPSPDDTPRDIGDAPIGKLEGFFHKGLPDSEMNLMFRHPEAPGNTHIPVSNLQGMKVVEGEMPEPLKYLQGGSQGQLAEGDPPIEGTYRWSVFGPRQSDNWQKDNRDWPDPTEPRAAKPPALKGCTCHEGDKLNCPVHGLNAGDQDLDHTWHLPENNPVNYPSDAPRNWQQAFGKEADYYHYAPTVERARIKQHGLQPSRPGINPRWEGRGVKNQPQGVYVDLPPDEKIEGRMWNFSDEFPEAADWDLWRIPKDQIQEQHDDPAIPGAQVIPHAVYPELEEPGPEIFGPWPERRGSVLSPLLTIN